jgi:phosphatidylinositol-3-phosphatase
MKATVAACVGRFYLGFLLALITVHAVGAEPFALLSPTNAWRYNDESVDLGTNWIAPAYDDSTWSNGLSTLGFRAVSNTNYPLPPPNFIRTLLRKNTPTNSAMNIMTFYFRTHFTFTNDPAGIVLIASNLIDDGAIFYINGREIQRVRMPEGTVTWDTPAIGTRLIGTTRTPTATTYGYAVFSVPVNALVQGDNVAAVEVHQGSFASASMAFQMELWMEPSGPPVFDTQPLSATVFPGTNVTMSVSLTGGRDASIQWFHHTSPLRAATNSVLTFSNILVEQGGRYYAVASNSFGMATSSVAGLTVIGGESKLRVLEFTNVWRFDQSGADLGTAWRAPVYDDSSWPSGTGVLIRSPHSGFPEPTNQVLSLTGTSGDPIITYYFRTHLALPPGVSNVVLVASNLLDDGAVFYANGAEAARSRLNGIVTAVTFAQSSPNNGLSYETMLLPSTNLVSGDNVLAVEVHQSAPGSADVVFGMNLYAYGAFNQPVVILTPPRSQTVEEQTPVSFFADVIGAQSLFFQWFRNGVPIADGTNRILRIDVAHPANAGNYTFIASNALNVVTSTVATLSVIPDVVPPTLTAAYGTNGIAGLVVVFSDPVAPQSATNTANYVLSSPVNILSAQMIAPNIVLLTTSGLGPPFDYTLWVTNVSDLADSPNFIAPNASVHVQPNRFSLPTGLMQVQTVFIIVMENKDWSDIKGSTNAPYINSLLPQASYCERYTSPTNLHPSQPNYIWLEAGDHFGHVNSDGPFVSRISSTNHLSTQLHHAGIEWRGYMESLPYGRTGLLDSYPYVGRHNPFAFFDDITMNTNYCTNHVRPYAEFAGDLAGGKIGRYNFIVPNDTNDMHSGPPGSNAGLGGLIKQGDDWLSRELPQILNSAAFSNNGAVFITFDENDFSTNAMAMIVLSPLAKGGGYASYVPYDHSSTLRTMQEIFGVRPYLGAAANASPLNDLFKDLSLSTVRSNGVLSLRLDGVLPGRTNYVQASSNLVTWTTINTNVATNSIVILDPDAASSPQRFYRAIEQQ